MAHDSMEGRRKRGRPERAKPMHEDMQKLIDMWDAANVSPKKRARALAKRYGSIEEQREAFKALAKKPSGQHAGRTANKGK